MAMAHFMSPGKEATQDNPKTIVHISSIAGEMASGPVAIYHATKWGLRGFIYSMTEFEATRNIRIAGVAPALVRTRLWLEAEDKLPVALDKNGKEINDWTTPEEVAEVVSESRLRS